MDVRRSCIVYVSLLAALCVASINCPAYGQNQIPADERKRDEFFMATALELARSAVRHGNYPFGALLVKDDRIVVRAENTVFTDKRISHHAEINTIDKAFRDLKVKTLRGYTLYTSSEPCPMCSGLIFLTGISVVVYGAPQSYLVDLVPRYKEIGLTNMTKLPDQRVEIRGPVLRKEAEKILKDFVEAEKLKRGK